MNPDLQHEFGRSSANARSMAKQQWVDYGFKQTNRTIAVPNWDETWWCGHTLDQDLECGCQGTLYYGYRTT